MSPTPRVSHCGKTELKKPPHQARFGQNQAQNAAALRPTSAKPNTKCRGVKPNSAKPNIKCRLNPDFGKTGLKMPLKHRIRQNIQLNSKDILNPDCRKTTVRMSPKSNLWQNRSQNAAESIPTSAKPNSKCRLNPDSGKQTSKCRRKPEFGKSELKMPLKHRFGKTFT